jgi:hypothetical protein
MWRLMICTPYTILFGCPNQKYEMGGACSMYRERRGVYRVLVGRPEEKRPLGRPRCRWEDNINMELQEVGLRVMD